MAATISVIPDLDGLFGSKAEESAFGLLLAEGHTFEDLVFGALLVPLS